MFIQNNTAIHFYQQQYRIPVVFYFNIILFLFLMFTYHSFITFTNLYVHIDTKLLSCNAVNVLKVKFIRKTIFKICLF